MRRLITFLLVALLTTFGSLWWLHDGDMHEAVEPVLAQWDAEGLARNAGIRSEDDVGNDAATP